MVAKFRSLIIKEAWGQVAASSGKADEQWKRKHLTLTAYDGYEAYIGTLPLDKTQNWEAGTYTDLEDDKFNSALATMQRIPDSSIYPMFEAGLHTFDPEVPPNMQCNYFIKLPNISSFRAGNGNSLANIMLAEARANEMFLSQPHPHLGPYLGCVVHDGRIVRLAFPKYIETLGGRVARDSLPIEEQETCMKSIEEAMRHLHSLGYAHNDISASNIMFDTNGAAILVDLDSCTLFGDKIKKGGVVGGWRGPLHWGQQFKYSSIECDELSLQYVRNWLIELEQVS